MDGTNDVPALALGHASPSALCLGRLARTQRTARALCPGISGFHRRSDARLEPPPDACPFAETIIPFPLEERTWPSLRMAAAIASWSRYAPACAILRAPLRRKIPNRIPIV